MKGVRTLCGAGLVGLLAIITGEPTISAQIRGLTGTVTIADPALDLELLEATASDDGATVWLVVAARPKGQRAADAVTRVLRVTTAGVQASVDLPAARPANATPDPLRPSRRRVVQSVVLAPDGRPVVAMARSERPVSLLPVSANGREVSTSVPIRLAANADLTDLVRLPGGRLLLVGAAGLRPLVADVSLDGAVTWERVLPGDVPVVVESVSPTSDGGAALLGRSGSDPKSARLWVGVISGKGELVAQTFLPGHDGEIARLESGEYALVYDQIAGTGFDIGLKRLGADLKERATSPLLQKQTATGAYRVSAMAGGFVVAGVRDRGLWMARFDASGKELWSDARPPAPPDLEIVTHLELLPRARTLIVPASMYVVQGREQRQVVKVLRFSVD